MLDPSSAFFATDSAEKLVYCPDEAGAATRGRLSAVATVVCCGPAVDLEWVLADLRTRGVRRLVAEGGRSVLTQLLTADLADELQLCVAPVFVGDARAPRLVGDGAFPWTSPHRANLRDVRRLGDTVLLHYNLHRQCGNLPTEESK
jgi:5-amino-6-(5-phosphoribosylamino)uracil reductase